METLEYDMGYTTSEFARVLTGNFTGPNSEFDCLSQASRSWKISSSDWDLSVDITVDEQPPRVLGSISLPVLKVVFNITASDDQQKQNFFDKFFKYFHKGGG